MSRPTPLDPHAPAPVDLTDEVHLAGGNAVSVLLAEDRDVRAALVRDLVQDGLPDAVVTTCRTAALARELVGRQTFDLVLVGLALPDLPGLDVVDALHEGADRADGGPGRGRLRPTECND